MRKVFNTAVLGAVLVAGAVALSSGAAEAQSYPRIVGSDGNYMVDYGPMGQGTLVGGGRAMISSADNMNVTVLHLDAEFSQAPRPGFVPMIITNGMETETIYVRPAMMDMLRRARAAMPNR
jgi:hypothetical protein